jgi:outer membrane autotransporter protein
VLNLSVDSASQTTAMLTPMLEIGGRIALDDEMTLRPFVTAGVSVLSTDQWKQTGRLISAPAGVGGFTTAVPIDRVVGRVSAGVQLYTGRMMDFRLQYEGEYGGNLTAHGGSLVMSVNF